MNNFKLVATILAITMLIPFAVFAHEGHEQEEFHGIETPETLEEAKEFGQEIAKGLPEAIRQVWEKEVLPIWQTMWTWVKENILSQFQGIKDKAMEFFGKKVEDVRPFLEEEFEKEKQEITQEIEERIQEERNTLWERIKGFFSGSE